MKVFVKTLKGTNFEIEVKSEDTVADVKKTIETAQGADIYPCSQQMLIHQGKVLKDTTRLEENQVVENSFIVIMLSKNKPSPAGASTPVASTGQAASSATLTSARETAAPPAPAPVVEQAPSAPQPTPAAAPVSGEADAYGQAASNLVAGSTLETTVQQILDMGGGSWDRDTVVRALRAAFNNPERAVDYLYSGIPEQADVPLVARPPTAGQAANPPVQAPQPVAPSSIGQGGPNANPLDLFPQGIPNMGSNAAAGSLDFLRNSPQFQTLRNMVQSNPQILQPMLQELGKQNPQLMRLIQEHQADFLRLINEPGAGAGAGDAEGNLLSQLASSMPQAVSVTPEEREAIERLEAMGFRRETVLQVYFACNKNEELAANYLLDHMDELNEDEEMS